MGKGDWIPGTNDKAFAENWPLGESPNLRRKRSPDVADAMCAFMPAAGIPTLPITVSKCPHRDIPASGWYICSECGQSPWAPDRTLDCPNFKDRRAP